MLALTKLIGLALILGLWRIFAPRPLFCCISRRFLGAILLASGVLMCYHLVEANLGAEDFSGNSEPPKDGGWDLQVLS